MLTSISPNSAATGSPATTITLTGSGFAATSTATWNGVALTTTFISATSLQANVPAANLATAGTFSVRVDTSGAKTFTVGGGGGTPPPGWVKDFYDTVNTQRGGNSQILLLWDNKLATVAQNFADAMDASALSPAGPTGGFPGISDPVSGLTISGDYFKLNGVSINPAYIAQTWSGAPASGAAHASALGSSWWIFHRSGFVSVGNPTAYNRVGVGYKNGYAVVVATP